MTVQESINLAYAHHRGGRLAEAEQIYRRVLLADPARHDIRNLLGILIHQAGDPAGGIVLIEQAIAQSDGHMEYHLNLGLALASAAQWEKAIASYRRALRLKPDSIAAMLNLAAALRAADQAEQAIFYCQKVLTLDPKSLEANKMLGAAYHDHRQYTSAADSYARAVELAPADADAHNRLAAAFYHDGRIEQSITSYTQAVALMPNSPEPLVSLAVAYGKTGQRDRALACCRRALALDAAYAPAHWNLALLLLQQGDFENGWPEYEWRRQLPDTTMQTINCPQPQWDGSPLDGKTILLYAEQGFGDTLQFARYIPLLAGRAKKILLACHPALLTLLSGLRGVAECFPQPAKAVIDFDVYCPLPSLPKAFGTTPQSIPATVPYLTAAAAKVVHWRTRIGDDKRRRIGLAWAGRPTHVNDRNRSLPTPHLAPLAQAPLAHFFSLQKGHTGPPPQLELTDWTADLTDFSDTAALIECLDLVITVDTSIAHLAGALGKPVWILIPFAPDWRWMLDRADSPWYPTARLFRQPAMGDWDSAITEVAKSLMNET